MTEMKEKVATMVLEDDIVRVMELTDACLATLRDCTREEVRNILTLFQVYGELPRDVQIIFVEQIASMMLKTQPVGI